MQGASPKKQTAGQGWKNNIFSSTRTHTDITHMDHSHNTHITHAHPDSYQTQAYSRLDISRILTHPYLCMLIHIHVYRYRHTQSHTHSYGYICIADLDKYAKKILTCVQEWGLVPCLEKGDVQSSENRGCKWRLPGS